MSNPLQDIEDRKAQQDIGAFAFRIYEGARADGASLFEAFIVTVAYFRGIIGSSTDNQVDE